jgi:hypothetical protein
VDVSEECRGELFGIGHHEGAMAVRLQDAVGSIQELRCGLGNRASSAPGGEAHWLVGIGIEDKEGLRDFDGLGLMVFAVAAHLTLAGAAHAMGIDGQEVTAKMP